MSTLIGWSVSLQGIDAFFGVALGVVAALAWVWNRMPHRRLRKLYKPIDDWWNDFSLHVGDREEDRRLGQLESKVTAIIKDSGVEFWEFRFDTNVRSSLLRTLGVKGSHGENRELFERWTKLPFDGTDLSGIWLQISLAAHRFRGAYPDCTLETAIQNVENPLKCLKYLVGFNHASDHK